MPFYSVLIPSLLLSSAVLADNNKAFGGVSLNGAFDSIYTTLEIPAMTGKYQDGALAFVSLDYDTDCSTSVQLGLNFSINQYPEVPSYQVWYQVQSSGYQPIDTTNLPLDAGTTVALRITAHSASTVSLYIANVDIGGFITSPPIETGSQICGRTAGWFVSSVPYADNPSQYHDVCNFGTLKFKDATARGPGGDLHSPKESYNFTYVSLDNGTTVAETIFADQNAIDFAYVYDEIP